MVRIASEKVSDRNEDYGAECRCGKRIPEAAAKNSELYEDPAANKGTDQADNNVRDAAEATAASDFSRELSVDEADQEPADKASAEMHRECVGSL